MFSWRGLKLYTYSILNLYLFYFLKISYLAVYSSSLHLIPVAYVWPRESALYRGDCGLWDGCGQERREAGDPLLDAQVHRVLHAGMSVLCDRKRCFLCVMYVLLYPFVLLCDPVAMSTRTTTTFSWSVYTFFCPVTYCIAYSSILRYYYE